MRPGALPAVLLLGALLRRGGPDGKLHTGVVSFVQPFASSLREAMKKWMIAPVSIVAACAPLGNYRVVNPPDRVSNGGAIARASRRALCARSRRPGGCPGGGDERGVSPPARGDRQLQQHQHVLRLEHPESLFANRESRAKGDAAAAAEHASDAMKLGTNSVLSGALNFHITEILALRARASASARHDDEALFDAAQVQQSPDAPPEALARAALAEAVVFGRRGDLEKTRSLFDRKSSLILEASNPRERALARALRRKARPRQTSAYRESALPAKEVGARYGTLGDWISKIAPEASGFPRDFSRPQFVQEDGETILTSAILAPSIASRKVVGGALPSPDPAEKARRFARLLGWLLRCAIPTVLAGLTASFIMVRVEHWSLRAHGSRSIAHGLLSAPAMLALSIPVSLVVMVIATLRNTAHLGRTLLQASRHFAIAEDDQGRALLEPLTKNPSILVVSEARLLLAGAAERTADPAVALAHCDAALEPILASPRARVQVPEKDDCLAFGGASVPALGHGKLES